MRFMDIGYVERPLFRFFVLFLITTMQKGDVMEKSPIFIGVVSPLNGCVGIGLAKGKEHTRQRRALAPSLSKTALKGQEAILQVHVNKLVAAIRDITRAKQEAINIADWCKLT